MSARPSLSPTDMKAFEPAAKIGLLATLDPHELPHLTLITSLRAKSPTELVWGQFTEGRSKRHVRQDPRTAYLVMNRAREIWRGKARWRHARRDGEDYVALNQQPMFRYNSYLGIHTVHYLELVATQPKERLSLPRLAAGLAMARWLGAAACSPSPRAALKPWAERHLGRLTTLHYLARQDADGYPTIVPVVPCRAVDASRLVLVPTDHRAELGALPARCAVAVLGLNLEMQSVLVRGVFAGYRRIRGVPVGIIDIDWVYNSMPPLPGPVYPAPPLEPVTEFE